MQNYLFPLHKISDTTVDYLGFATGNLYYIVKAEVDATYITRVNYSYFTTQDRAEYMAAIDVPSSVTYTQTFPMGEEINFDFLFSII
jgi:hypothetical protein